MLWKPSSCKGCMLREEPYGKREGYVPASGTGDNGVVVVLEAAGKDEEQAGVPTVGAAGYFLWKELRRWGKTYDVNLDREGFRIHNCLSCRPPNNKLVKMPWEEAAIAHCAPKLDKTLADHRAHALSRGKTPVILALGKIAFKRIMGLEDKDPLFGSKRRTNSYYCYPFWNERYQMWVVSGPHPSFLLQGNRAQIPMMTYAAERAVRIANTRDYQIEKPDHLCDPSPRTFEDWVEEYIRAHKRDPEVSLAFDIETPFKVAVGDEEDASREEDHDWTILRHSFAWGRERTEQCVSIVDSPHYRRALERIYGYEGSRSAPAEKVGWNSDNYDVPRVQRKMPVGGTFVDGMLAYHVLHSSRRKGLGAVVPFYCPDHPMWKHWSGNRPALYNAIDSDVTLRSWIGIKHELRREHLWEPFYNHVYRLNQALAYMRDQGVVMDDRARDEAERVVQGLLDESNGNIQAAVPREAKPLKIYKKEPKDAFETVEVDDDYELQPGERWASQGT